MVVGEVAQSVPSPLVASSRLYPLEKTQLKECRSVLIRGAACSDSRALIMHGTRGRHGHRPPSLTVSSQRGAALFALDRHQWSEAYVLLSHRVEPFAGGHDPGSGLIARR